MSESITGISQPAPQVPDSVIEKTLLERYGLRGTWRPLLSERDQNLWVQTPAGEHYVFKIANASEDGPTTATQVTVLEHLRTRDCAVQTPQVMRSQDGRRLVHLNVDGVTYRCRLVTFVQGQPLSSQTLNVTFAEDFGRRTADLLAALSDYELVIDRQPLLWDIQNASQLRSLLPHVKEPALHDAAEQAIDDFDQRVLQRLTELDSQTIHGDLNDDNVIARDADTLAGVIDFGDMVRAPRVCELAIAAAYLRGTAEQPLKFIAPYLRGFRQRDRLSETEADLLFDLIRVRLTASITILRWRLAERGEGDEYAARSLGSERTAEAFLHALDQLGRARVNAVFRQELSF